MTWSSVRYPMACHLPFPLRPYETSRNDLRERRLGLGPCELRKSPDQISPVSGSFPVKVIQQARDARMRSLYGMRIPQALLTHTAQLRYARVQSRPRPWLPRSAPRSRHNRRVPQSFERPPNALRPPPRALRRAKNPASRMRVLGQRLGIPAKTVRQSFLSRVVPCEPLLDVRGCRR